MGFFEDSDSIPQRLCNDEIAWGIVKDLEFEDVQKIRYAEVYKHYTQEYVGERTPSVLYLLIVLESTDIEIDIEFIKTLSEQCYRYISEIRFYNSKDSRYVDRDCILMAKRIKQPNGSTRPFVVARPGKPVPAVS